MAHVSAVYGAHYQRSISDTVHEESGTISPEELMTVFVKFAGYSHFTEIHISQGFSEWYARLYTGFNVPLEIAPQEGHAFQEEEGRERGARHGPGGEGSDLRVEEEGFLVIEGVLRGVGGDAEIAIVATLWTRGAGAHRALHTRPPPTCQVAAAALGPSLWWCAEVFLSSLATWDIPPPAWWGK